jgi:Putative DNA-binding domain
VSSSSLHPFFEEFIPYVMGERSYRDLEARLGPSPSGQLGMRVYSGVVLKNLKVALDAMYPAVKRAAEAARPGLWTQVAASFLAAHPPRHADPNKCGEPLADFLAQRRAAGDSLPVFLEELADYESIRFRTVTARSSGPERTVFVRHYSHAVSAYAAPDAEKTPSGIPVAAPVTLVVYRSTVSLKARVLTPSKAQLLALARHWGELHADLWSKSGLAASDLDRATGELRDMGVLEQEVSPP